MRANISPAWYTWLEQGRGGAASADVLDRLARALLLTDVEREHLFLLGLGRPPEVHYQLPDSVTGRLQRLLDAMPYTPAIVKTATWDVLAWNQAAALVLHDYGALPRGQRNILRILFSDTGGTTLKQAGANPPEVWLRPSGSTLREPARKMRSSRIELLCTQSGDFAAMWSENGVQSFEGMVKRLHHPELGEIDLEYSSLAIDGRPHLAMAVYSPILPADRRALQLFIQSKQDERD